MEREGTQKWHLSAQMDFSGRAAAAEIKEDQKHVTFIDQLSAHNCEA
jgi:hypothetical protein